MRGGRETNPASLPGLSQDAPPIIKGERVTMDIKQLLAMCVDDAKNEEDASIIMKEEER